MFSALSSATFTLPRCISNGLFLEQCAGDLDNEFPKSLFNVGKDALLLYSTCWKTLIMNFLSDSSVLDRKHCSSIVFKIEINFFTIYD